MVTGQEQLVVTQSAPRPKAPGSLRLVQEFVNSADIEEGTDDIADPAGLRSWLAGHGLPVHSSLDAAGVTRAISLREALRAQLLAHDGAAPTPDAIATINRAAEDARLGPRFGPAGSYRLQPAAAGIDGALGWIVAAVSAAIDAGTWDRLKACRNETCQWAFYDASRNRSGAWCRMAVCGNRSKVRAFRERRRAAGGASSA